MRSGNSDDYACRGKQGFNTFPEGAAAIKRIRRTQHVRKSDGELTLYRCPYCPNWHIGSTFQRAKGSRK